MWAFIFSLIIIITLFLTRAKFGTIKKVNVIFTLIWCGTCFISALDILGLRMPGDITFLLMAMFCVFFNIFFFMFSKRKYEESCIEILNFDIICNNLLVINFLIYVWLIPLMMKSVKVLIASGLISSVRMNAYFDENASMFFTYFMKVIPMGIINVLVLVWVFLQVYAGQKNTRIWIMIILDVLVITFVSGGRYVFLTLIFSYILSILYLKPQFNIKFKIRYLVIPVSLLVLITSLRGGKFFQQAFRYFCGSASFFDLTLSNPDVFALNDKMYGAMTFGAIIEPIVLFLKVLGMDLEVPSYYFNIVGQRFYDIGSTSTVLFNNNTSILYYFIRDYGYVGVFIGAILAAKIITKYQSKAEYSRTLSPLFVFFFFSIVLFQSIMTYSCFSFSGTVQLLSIITIGKCIKVEHHYVGDNTISIDLD